MGIDSISTTIKPVVAALLERAESFAINGEADHAAAFFRAAVTADLTPVARIAYAVFLADTEREVAARKLLEEAWEIARRLKHDRCCALACHNLAALHRRLDQFVIADSYQQQAISAWMRQTSGDPLPSYLLAGRACDVALRESVAADRLWTASQVDIQEQAAATLNRAVVAHRQGRLPLAGRLFREAFQHAESRRELATCAAILTNLAQLERQLGRWTIADECLAVAERIERDGSRPRSTVRISAMRQALAQGLAMLSADPSWN